MKSNRARNNYSQNRNICTGNMYVYGAAAPKVNFDRQLEEVSRQLSNEARKNREKAKHMSLGYVAFLITALMVAGVVLIGYIRLQADINSISRKITAQEREINSLRIENAEALTRIESSLDLEEIKKVAIQELGMTYPKEGQIVTYEGAEYDYMRKVTESK